MHIIIICHALDLFTMAGILPAAESLCYRNLLVVIKQTAFEEYSQVRGEMNKRGPVESGHVCPETSLRIGIGNTMLVCHSTCVFS